MPQTHSHTLTRYCWHSTSTTTTDQIKSINQVQITPTPAILLLHRSASTSCTTLSNSTILSHIQQQTQQILAQSATSNNAPALVGTQKQAKPTDGSIELKPSAANCKQKATDSGNSDASAATISSTATNALSSAIANGTADDGSTPPPAKKMKCDPKDMVDVCVGTSVGTITEPDCLGPCEPGTSVTLEGIVWHETEGGVLVVNVTWRGKTYVGTLLDCTRHDWAPPR